MVKVAVVQPQLSFRTWYYPPTQVWSTTTGRASACFASAEPGCRILVFDSDTQLPVSRDARFPFLRSKASTTTSIVGLDKPTTQFAASLRSGSNMGQQFCRTPPPPASNLRRSVPLRCVRRAKPQPQPFRFLQYPHSPPARHPPAQNAALSLLVCRERCGSFSPSPTVVGH